MRLTLGLFALGMLPGLASAVEPPRLRELRTQQVGNITYFHVRFDRPANIWPGAWNSREINLLPKLPRLVPQDAQTRSVVTSDPLGSSDRSARGLEFYGRRNGTGVAKFLLLYTTAENRNGKDVHTAIEAPVEIDFQHAVVVPPPPPSSPRNANGPVDSDDLKHGWALAQAHELAMLEAQTADFSFYAFARTALQRTDGVKVTPIGAARGSSGPNEHYRRLYETTTGAAAVTESLQLHRMLKTDRKESPRDIDIAKLPGIEIAEHPWLKMMEGKTPDVEPIARLVPHDNYFVHFKSFAKFIELGDFADEWGTNAMRAYEVQSREFRIRDRYEKQLCLKTSLLGRTLGPFVIKGVAVTGSDGYLREGSDVTVIFHVVDAKLFRAGVEPYLAAARKEFGDRLKTAMDEYDNVTIESYVSPRREVSLWRASFGDYVVYSNSPAGVRRILDARAGRIKPLAESLDYQYMRTAFRHSDAAEDGFAFFSDAFIRQLVGPASKIKEKRRLEGFAGLHMATNSVLWHAWDTGKPPPNLDTALAHSGLTRKDLATHDQTSVGWLADNPVAVSDRYNTVHFATPLIEMPIDRVTKQEEAEYRQFREEYLRLWGEFFDPVGVRVKLNGGKIKVETYILPLIRNQQYAQLRSETDGGTVPLNASPPTAKTVAQGTMHIGPNSQIRWLVANMSSFIELPKVQNWLGNWIVIRFDDSPVYAKLAALNDSGSGQNWAAWLDLISQMPATIGLEVQNPLALATVLTGLRGAMMKSAPAAVTWEPLPEPYRGVPIVRIQESDVGLRSHGGGGRKSPISIYYASVNGAWYASLQEQPIRDMIDRHVAGAAVAAGDARPVNSAIFAAPANGPAVRDYVRGYLETESHKRSLVNLPVWYAFERSGLLAARDRESSRQDLLYQYLGCVPVSPEGAAYVYERRTDEMRNVRHGSLRTPTPQAAVAADSTLGKLLDQLRTLSADLRFREDGIHTTVTVEKK